MMERRSLEEEDGNTAATPRTSFCLLEADEDSDNNAVRASDPLVFDTNNHSKQLSLNQRQLYDIERNAQTLPPNTRIAAEASSAAHRRLSIGDLFPMNTFTTSENIMPTLQDAIVIDDLQPLDQSQAQGGGGSGGDRNTLNNSIINNNNNTFGSSSRILMGNLNSVNSGVHIVRKDGSSAMDILSLDEEIGGTSTIRDSSSSDDGEGGRTVRRYCGGKWCCSPASWLRSLWNRMQMDWDSYFLLVTLLLAVISVFLAIIIAATISSNSRSSYRPRCTLASRKERQYPISTASISFIAISIMNHLVLFIVALWIGIRCSNSRKSVMKSAHSSISSNLTTAFMLPCYEAIWYMIAILSAAGVVLYPVSYDSVPDSTDNDDGAYPCEVTTLPFVWALQLLPMLMIQRSISQEAVVRSIVYSGGVCMVMLICLISLSSQGPYVVDAVAMGIHILLLGFYFWAKFGFHARTTFDFFFLTAVVTSTANITVEIMAIYDLQESHTISVARCVVAALDSLIVVAMVLSLRADTRYWLAIGNTSSRNNPVRQYVHLLSERGMITNFSTRTSVYDVHRMIEEHRHNVVDFSALKLNCIVAQGATSIVMRGTLRGTTDIALKIYTAVQVTDEEVHRFSRETALNVQLSHPNVVKFYGLCVVPPSISLIFEFCEYGGLDVTLRNNSWGISTKLKAWLDACKAVAYLHSFSPPLLHRDIKTDNFLVGQDFVVKLTDFGEANLLRPRTDGTMTIAGTVDYMAPEMIVGGKTARYGTAVDVYSLMITLWQIMVPDRSPWEGKSHLEVYNSVTNGERPPLLPQIPRGCAEILESGWAANPMDRVPVEEIIPKVHRLWLLSFHQKELRRTKT